MSNEDELVTVATYRFAPKAEMARALLEQEGFEVFVADATLVTTGWLLGGAVGHIKLQVPTQRPRSRTVCCSVIRSCSIMDRWETKRPLMKRN